MRIGRKIRERRLARGALELASQEIRFELNDKKDPIKLSI
jgi:exoribonuclease R